MPRKIRQITYIRVLAVLCIVAVISSLLFLFSHSGISYNSLLLLVVLDLLLIILTLFVYKKVSKFSSLDINVLKSFLTSKDEQFEVELRKLHFQEFEDIAIAINLYAERRAMRLEALNQANDTLSININKSNKELAEANKKLLEEIREHEKTEESLEKTLKVAEEANRAKSEFLSNMRHEIRTPMNAIIGMTDLVLDSEISDKQKELLTVVRESGESLLKIINDILDLAKLETDEVILSHDMFVLEDTLEVTARNFEDEIKTKGLSFKFFIDDDVPGMVYGDYNRLTKVLYNLVDNAVKFTEKGGITIYVKNKSVDDSELILHFIVKDTGIGIEQSKRDRIFLPFSQLDGSYTRQFEGTGLGLSIAARTVEMMGGVIWIDDDDSSNGTSFNFIVHLEKAAIPGIEQKK